MQSKSACRSRRIPAQVAERPGREMGSSDLTGREIEVLEQIVAGTGNKAIANRPEYQ